MTKKCRVSALLGTTLAGLALAGPVIAQGPPPGGFGQGQGGFGGNGGQGGRFGGQRRAPFTTGTVKSVDANAGTITITNQAGTDQTINVDSTVHPITQTTLSVSDLKVGDTIAVRGVPTGITASQITVGDPPAGLPGGGGFGGRGGGGNNGGNGGNAAGGGANATQSFATATGTVKALPTKTDAHLTISLGADTQLFLKVGDGAKITRWDTLTLDKIKAGDRIMAMGQTGTDGSVTATMVGVNLTQGFGGPGGGFGGPGGGGPGGGFGGPGGGGPGGGGFGGPPPGGGGFGGPPPDGGPGGPPPGQ